MNRILNISILLLFLCEVGISAQSELIRHHKTRFDEYTASAINKLTLSNRHGHIQYTGWDKDTLAVRISIWVEAPTEAMAAEVHDQIDISQRPTGKTLDYSTVFSEGFFSNYNFGIDYHIFGPQALELEILNRLGNITIEEYFGKATITAEYGHLRIASFHEPIPQAIIQITNGDLDIGQLKKADITHKNGQLELGGADELSLTADFSVARIHRVNQLKLTTTTSQMNIGQAGSVNVKTKHTNLVISNLQQQGFIEGYRGSIHIESFESGLRELTLSGDRCPIRLHLAEKMPFSLHGQVINGQFFYPENKKIKIFRENNTLSFSADYSAKNKPAPKLIIFNKNSDIHLIVNQ